MDDEEGTLGGDNKFFLTAVARQVETKPLVSVAQKKLINVLNLTDIPTSQYSDTQTGPLKPGLLFYKWMLRSPPLHIPIADTLIVENNICRLLYTDAASGIVMKSKPKSHSETGKERFIMEVLNRFIGPSLTEPHLASKPGPICRRIAAVLKRPVWKATVANDTEFLLPLPLTAHLMDAVDGKKGPYVIQRFMWCRGKKPSLYRCFWKAARGNAARSLVIWNISSNDNFGEYVPAPSQSFSAVRGNNNDPNAAAALPVDGRSDPRDGAAFMGELDRVVRNYSIDLRAIERSDLLVAGSNISRSIGLSYSTSLSEPTENNIVTDKSCLRISATKVVGTSEELELYTDRLASWIEAAVLNKENLSLQLSDLVVDFIRDDADRYSMVQVKGFRLFPDSIGSVQRWLKQKDEQIFDIKNDLAAPIEKNPDDVPVPIAVQKQMAQTALREKLEDTRGVQCKLCGLSFVEGQTIRVPMSQHDRDLHQAAVSSKGESKPEGAKTESLSRNNSDSNTVSRSYSQNNITRTASGASRVTNEQTGLQSNAAVILPDPDSGTRAEDTATEDINNDGIKEAPVFGYQVSMKMACHLAEIYRDSEFPLTIMARDILLDYCKIVDIPRDENGVSGDSKPSSVRKKRTGWLLCCYYCFEILEEFHYFQYTSDKLYNALGVDTSSSSARNAKPNSKFVNTLLSNGFEKMGKFVPWTINTFDKGTGQWKLLVLAHYITDANIEPEQPFYGVDCCLTYVLGQSAISLPYRNIQESDDFEDKLIWIKQCRLHSFFGTRRAAAALFMEKDIEFHLFFTRKGMFSNENSKNKRKTQEQQHPSELQWETSFKVSLHQIKWAQCSENLEKIDMMIPITTSSCGNMILKLSVAVEFKEHVPWQAAECNYQKEQDIFWPPSNYNDSTPLPAAWLSLMTRERKINEFNVKKRPGALHFYDSEKEERQARELQSITRASKNTDPRLVTGTVESLKSSSSRFASIGFNTAAAAAAASEKYRNRSAHSNSDIVAEGYEREFGDDAMDLVKFNRISALIPFIARVFDRQKRASDGTVDKLIAMNAIADALNACVAEPTLVISALQTSGLTQISKQKFFLLPICFIEALDPSLKDPELIKDALISMLTAFKEIIQSDMDSDDRPRISWVNLVKNIAKYVSIVLKREKHEALVHDVQSKLHLNYNTEKVGEKGIGALGVISTKRAGQLSKVLMDISNRLRGTILDVLPREDDSNVIPDIDIEPVQLPPSQARRYRRLMFVLSIFSDISRRSDSVDASELKQYLEEEKKSLVKCLGMIKSGIISVPVVTASYVSELGAQFSLSRAVMCCHLLASSEKLQQLFTRYETHGVAIISQIGFLKTCEECFQSSLKSDGEIADILNELKEIADEEYSKKKFRPRAVNLTDDDKDSEIDSFVKNSPSRTLRQRAQLSQEVSLKVASGDGVLRRMYNQLNRVEEEKQEKAEPLAPIDIFQRAGKFVRTVIHTLGIESFEKKESAAPALICLTCDIHGVELFFYTDLCCTLCEQDNHKKVRR